MYIALTPACLCLLVLCAVSLFHSISSSETRDLGNYSAICAVAKDENRYIREWAEYHLCLGEEQQI